MTVDDLKFQVKHVPLLLLISLAVIAGTVALKIKVFLFLGIPVLILMLRNPQFALQITAASTITGFMFYFTDTSAVVTVSIPKLCGLVTLLSLIVYTFHAKKTFYFGSRVIVPLAYIFLGAVTLVYSPIFPAGKKTIAQLLGSFAFYFLAVNIITDLRFFKKLIITLVVCYTLLGLWGIVQFFMPSQWTDEYAIQNDFLYQAFVDRGIKRTSGFSHPGVISFILNLLIPYNFYLYHTVTKRRNKLLVLASIVICVNAVLMTHTRVAFLGLILMAILLSWKRFIKINVPIACGIIIAGMVYLFFFMPSTFSARVLSFSDYLQEGSVQIRLENQGNALAFLIGNPVGGIGIGNFEELSEVDRPVNKEVTNMLLEVAAETGLPGFMAMLFFLALVVKDALRVQQYYRSESGCNLGTIMLISIAVTLFSSFFMENQDFREWWLFMAFPVAINRVLLQERNSRQGRI